MAEYFFLAKLFVNYQIRKKLKKQRHQKNIILTIIAVLLFNLAVPALASIYSPDDKILICSQNGFEWISVDQKEQQYLELAKQLNLDIEQLFPEPVEQNQLSPPHGKCVLCFFEQVELAAILSNSEIRFPPFQIKSVVITHTDANDVALGKYQRPLLRAPPAFIHS